MNDCATLTANAVSTPSCVSPVTSLIFWFRFALLAFQRLTKNLAQRTCWLPMSEAGPVIGAAMPIVRSLPQVTDAVASELADARAGALAEPSAFAARIAKATAKTAATITFFMLPSSDSFGYEVRRQSRSFDGLIRARGGIARRVEHRDDPHR